VKGPAPLDVDGLVRALDDESGLAGFSVLPREE
jgi:hypothetical protein